jgi:hypothetical protein
MRLHWERYRCDYARDDLDSRKMIEGFDSAIEKLRKKAAKEGLTLEAWLAAEKLKERAAATPKILDASDLQCPRANLQRFFRLRVRVLFSVMGSKKACLSGAFSNLLIAGPILESYFPYSLPLFSCHGLASSAVDCVVLS